MCKFLRKHLYRCTTVTVEALSLPIPMQGRLSLLNQQIKETIMDTYELASHVVEHGGATLIHKQGEFTLLDRAEFSPWVVATPHRSNIKYENTDYRVGKVQDKIWEWTTTYHRSSPVVFGVWIDPDTSDMYIDLVEFHEKDDAVRLAKERGEKAIYNMETGETLYV